MLRVIKNSVQTKHPARVKLYVSHMALVQRSITDRFVKAWVC